MTKRKCFDCNEHIPPESEHFIIDNEVYCTECIEVTPYTAFMYFLNGEFMGHSDDDRVDHVQSYEDDYEEEV